MTNALNTEFLSNPLTFIQNADYAVGGHDDLVQAMGGTRASTIVRGTELYRNAEVFLGYVDALGVISFELVKYKNGSRKMVMMRPVVDPAIFQMKEIGKSFAAPPSNPIQGYWFPYKVPTTEQMTAAKKAGGGGPPKVMGYVDFEKKNPKYPFVFTGSMQGCHIVVTRSPQKPNTHFRAYHYASPGNYRGQAGDMAYLLWPASVGGQVCAWLDDSQYGADPKNDAVDAFNFLHYSGGQWRIYTQKQKRDLIFGDKSAVVMFTVMDTAVSEPIPDQPLSNAELIASYKAWDQRCKEWAAFRFGKKVDNVRVIDGR